MMQAIMLPSDQFQELVSQISEIKSLLQEQNRKCHDELLSNEDFISLLRVSRRTAQNWRNSGKISFSQVNGKIYYRWGDIQKLMDEHYVAGFAKAKNYGRA